MTSSNLLTRVDNTNLKFDPHKQTLIVLEGSDKSGKSTIYQKLRRGTMYQPLVIDRFIGSNIVYDQFYDRAHSAGEFVPEYTKDESLLAGLFNLVVVVVEVDEKEALKRIEKGESGVDKEIALNNFKSTKELFRSYLASSPALYKYTLNTTGRTPDECVQALLKEFLSRGYNGPTTAEDPEAKAGHRTWNPNQFTPNPKAPPSYELTGRNPILRAVYTLAAQIYREGEHRENTLELLAPRLEIDLLNPRVPEIKTWEEMEADVKLFYGEDRYAKRLEDELFHYRQLEYALLHKVEELAFFNKEGLETRKNIVFSNDCISSIQYLKRQNASYLVVHMRSSDVQGLLPMDLLYLASMLRRVNTNYLQEQPKKVVTGQPVEYEGLIVTLGSAHIYTSGGRG